MTRRLGAVGAGAVVVAGLAWWGARGGDGDAGGVRTVGSYQVRVPEGWTAAVDDGTLRIVHESKAAAAARLHFTTGGITAAAAPRLVAPLAAALGGEVTGPFMLVDDTMLAARSSAGGRTVVGVVAWTPSPRGSSVLALAMSEPADTPVDVHQQLGDIVESIRLAPVATGDEAPGGDADAPPVEAPRYVAWRDPVEGAFSVEVPQGWSARGGLTRMAPVDVRSELRAADPAGEIVLMLGDRSLPTFTEPNAMLAMAGLHEGAPYSPGFGVTMIVRSYLDGAGFARTHAAQLAGGACAGVAIDDSRPRPDLDEAINASYARFASAGLSVSRSSGEATFTCGGGRHGYVLATTERVATPGGGSIWTVSALFGYVAAAARETDARTHLSHLASTWAIDPAWAQAQNNTAMNVSAIVRDTGHAISRIITEGYEQRQQRMDAVAERRAHAFRGTTEVVDPVTGERRTIENRSEYYWVAPNGTIAGTDVDATPGVEFRRLDRLF